MLTLDVTLTAHELYYTDATKLKVAKSFYEKLFGGCFTKRINTFFIFVNSSIAIKLSPQYMNTEQVETVEMNFIVKRLPTKEGLQQLGAVDILISRDSAFLRDPIGNLIYLSKSVI